MRKISHINLGSFLLEQEDFQMKRKTFLFGNILPDCLPTFIYVKHNIDRTITKVEKLLEDLYKLDSNSYRFWIKLGCIMHYIADYFTYPHTRLYHDGFWKHNFYEKRLKDRFREHLEEIQEKHIQFLRTSEELIFYIKEKQNSYFSEKKQNRMDVDLDIDYIYEVCYTIFENICYKKQLATI